MNTEDLELKFLLGQSVVIDGLIIRSPSIQEVVALGYENYNMAMSAFLFDKNKFPELAKVPASNLEILSHYYANDSSFRECIMNCVRLVFGSEIEISENGFKIGEAFLNADNYEVVKSIVMKANKISSKEEEEELYNPANSKAKEIIEKLKRDKVNKPQRKPITNIHSLISGLSWKSNSINIMNIEKLTIYQLYDGYLRMENIDHYNSILTGIYTGNVDSTKVKIQDNTWTKIID